MKKVIEEIMKWNGCSEWKATLWNNHKLKIKKEKRNADKNKSARL